jgi:chromosome segregation ATPase
VQEASSINNWDLYGKIHELEVQLAGCKSKEVLRDMEAAESMRAASTRQAALNGQLRRLKARHFAHVAEKAALAAAKAGWQDAVQGLKAQLATCQAQAQADAEAAAASSVGLQQLVHSLIGELDERDRQMAGLQDKVQQLKAQLATCEEQAQADAKAAVASSVGLQQQVESLVGDLLERSRQVEDGQKDVQAAHVEAAQTAESLAACRTHIASLQDQVDSLSGQLKQRQANVGQQEEERRRKRDTHLATVPRVQQADLPSKAIRQALGSGGFGAVFSASVKSFAGPLPFNTNEHPVVAIKLVPVGA